MNKRVQDENTLLAHYLDSDEGFLKHIGLSTDATWGDFRQHYARGKGIDIERAATDLATYPPVARHIASGKRS